MLDTVALEASFVNFFAQVDAIVREQHAGKGFCPFTAPFDVDEKALSKALFTCQRAVHGFLCDSFDTPSVLKALQGLMSDCRIYLKNKGHPSMIYSQLICEISSFIEKILRIFGLCFTETGASSSSSQVCPTPTSIALP